MEFIYNDGGRSKYYKGKNVNDCVVRAICNASGKDYKEVYDRINQLIKSARKSKKEKHKTSARDGVYKRIYKIYIEEELGWKWHSCMEIGSGCQTHLTEEELPKNGAYIIKLSHHLTCIKDGVLYDTYDCSRDGNRCVYGYWYK